MVGSIEIIDIVAYEAMLFAGIGLLIGGFDDLLVDLCFIARHIARRGKPGWSLATLPAPAAPGRLIVFVAAWDEAGVLGAMLRTAVARYDHADYRIYVGLYPNDPATLAAVLPIAAADDRIVLVVGGKPGPTTKADCLNTLWHRLLADERRTGVATKAVILHDAEDVVHAAELRVFDTLVERYAVVQLPVLPLIKPGSLVSGHYADEFAEAHSKQMVVRTALRAGMPLAGTGCAIARPMLARIAVERGGAPFDATSLTEDYELGLRIAELGGQGVFARVDDGSPERIVAVRAYFPATVRTAVKQKARWMTGIALAGWDRTGWANPRALADHWMRMRDRRAPFAVLVIAVAYLAALAWSIRAAIHWAGGTEPREQPIDDRLFAITTMLLLWRLGARMICTGYCYDRREAMCALPRFFVGNLIALLAAQRALLRYVGMLAGQALVWDKTTHDFPAPSAGR